MAEVFQNIANEAFGVNKRNNEEWKKRKEFEAETQRKAVEAKQAADDLKTDEARAQAQKRRLAAAGGAPPIQSPLGSLGQPSSMAPPASGGKTLLGG